MTRKKALNKDKKIPTMSFNQRATLGRSELHSCTKNARHTLAKYQPKNKSNHLEKEDSVFASYNSSLGHPKAIWSSKLLYKGRIYPYYIHSTSFVHGIILNK
uniref:Uncharacterized protein n=1 Tax=Physcomitrium patens TaxID=3218 RepID=A0A2K1KNQ8_PHYPA|nr:hypothetical protein PHYPA_006309 [Physcomitrium patens]